MREYVVKLNNLTCKNCEKEIKNALNSEEVELINVNFAGGTLKFSSSVEITKKELITMLNSTKFDVEHFISQPISQKDDTTNENYDFDLLIIGSGSAAFSAAIKAAEYSKTVAIVERNEIGGTCVNVGCVPSKTLLRAGEINHLVNDHQFEGLNTSGKLESLETLMNQKNQLVNNLKKKKYIDLIDKYNIYLIKGEANFVDKKKVMVNEKIYSAKFILIATGASPFIPEIKGIGEVDYLTSTSIMNLKKIPQSLTIIGSGYIALELGQLFHHLGTKVTMLRRSSRLLKGYEPEVSEYVENMLTEQGINLINNVTYIQVAQSNHVTKVYVEVDGIKQCIESEMLLLAAGRKANTENLQLNNTSVQTNSLGSIIVDDFGKTSNDKVYAAGDVIGGPLFVYVAAYQGSLMAENMFNDKSKRMDLSSVPSVIFTSPSIATVGMTEDEAICKEYQVKTTVLPLESVPRALVNHDIRGLIKVVIEKDNTKLLGVQIVSENAGEVIYPATLAVKFGLTLNDLKETMVPYLTMSEGLKLALLSFDKKIEDLSCCAS